MLVYQDDQKKVRVRDLKAGKDLAEFTHPAEKANAPMRLSADGKTLYFGSEQGHLYRWDLVANKPVPGLGRHSLWTLTGLEVSPDESTLFTMGWNKAIRRWDLKTGRELPLPPGYHTQAFLEVAADGRHLFVGDHATQLDQWDLATGKKVRALSPEGNGGINALAASPDGKWLAAGRVVQDVQLWDVATGKLAKEIPLAARPDRSGGDQVQRVAFSPDSQVVYSLSPKTGTTAWEVPTGKKLWSTPGRFPQVAVDPKGRWVVAAGGYQNPPVPWAVLDAKTGQVVARVTVEPLDPEPGGGRGGRAPAVHVRPGVHPGRVAHLVRALRRDGPGVGRRDAQGTQADRGRHRAAGAGGVVAGRQVGRRRGVGGRGVGLGTGHREGRGPVRRAPVVGEPGGVHAGRPRAWSRTPTWPRSCGTFARRTCPTDGLWEALASDDAAKAYRPSGPWSATRRPRSSCSPSG